MSVLNPTNFETLTYNMPNWSSILNTNWEKLNDYMTTFEVLWQRSLSNGNSIKWNSSTNKWEVCNTNADAVKAELDYYRTLQDVDGDGNVTVDWTQSSLVKLTLTGDTTLSFTNPNFPCHLTLEIVQDSVGGHNLTFPSGIKWANGITPTLSTDANNISIVVFFFDGVNYLGQASKDFS